jgi:hypothetical protein
MEIAVRTWPTSSSEVVVVDTPPPLPCTRALPTGEARAELGHPVPYALHGQIERYCSLAS